MATAHRTGARARAAVRSLAVALLLGAGCTSTTAGSPTTPGTAADGASPATAAEVSRAASPAGGEPSPPVAAGSGAIVEVDPITMRVRRVVDLGDDPLLATGAGGGVWVGLLGDARAVRVDPETGAATDAGIDEVVGVAGDGDDVWLAAEGSRLVRLDAATGRVRATLDVADEPLFAPRNAGFVGVAGGSVWLTVPERPDAPSGPQSLWRIDVASGSVRSRIAIPAEPFPPVGTDGALWFVAADEEVVVRVDAGSERLRRIDVGAFPGPIAPGGGSVWVAHTGGIVALDPTSGRPRADLPFDDVIRGIAYADATLWVATGTSLVAVDPRTGERRKSAVLSDPSGDEGPIGVVPLAGSIWVTVE
jgi:hypothetical protein